MPIDLEQLERLMAEWKSLQPLPSAYDERLWLKLRLEWNFHSNHLEGNTLTYGETAAYLLHDQVSGNHTGREYAEMKGHDLAIALVRELAASPQDLTEADVRNLNQIILKEPFYKEAITSGGESTRKLITPGRYKEEPNSVRTSTGELFEYAAPVDVPVRMAKLVEVIRSCAGKEGLEFMAALAITHHEFTLIHPFDDGNGRVVRLVTNYVLLKKGLPPLVIKSERKKDYLSALRQADGGDPAMLADFFAEQLVWSLELGIKAGKGENLEELNDVEKQIALFIREKETARQSPRKLLVHDPQRLWSESLRPLLLELSRRTQEIGKLFLTRGIGLTIDHRYMVSFNEGMIEMPRPLPSARHVMIAVFLKGYRHPPKPFDIFPSIDLNFGEQDYKLSKGAFFEITKPYSTSLSPEEIDEVVSKTLKSALRMIKSKEASDR